MSSPSLMHSQLLPGRCQEETESTCNDNKSCWNPPETCLEISGGEEIIVRAMQEKDVPRANKIAKARNSINFTEVDLLCAAKCSNFGGLVAENKDGLIIGFASCMMYGSKLFTLGQVNVVPEYRRRGVSRAMKCIGINFLPIQDSHYELYLHGYTKKETYYSKMGLQIDSKSGTYFKFVGNFSDSFLKMERDKEILVKELCRDELQRLIQYDTTVHTYNRGELISGICTHPYSRTFVAFRNNAICGYGVLTKCYLAYRIAPLFADNPLIAKQLYSVIGRAAPPNCTLTLVVYNENESAIDIIHENNFEVDCEVWRVRQTDNDSSDDLGIDYSRVFSVTELNNSLC